MDRKSKLISRLRIMPRDFTIDELITVLGYFGYEIKNAGKTSGSAIKFVNEEDGKDVINIHKPHPSNILKRYVLEIVIEKLKERGYIK